MTSGTGQRQNSRSFARPCGRRSRWRDPGSRPASPPCTSASPSWPIGAATTSHASRCPPLEAAVLLRVREEGDDEDGDEEAAGHTVGSGTPAASGSLRYRPRTGMMTSPDVRGVRGERCSPRHRHLRGGGLSSLRPVGRTLAFAPWLRRSWTARRSPSACAPRSRSEVRRARPRRARDGARRRRSGFGRLHPRQAPRRDGGRHRGARRPASRDGVRGGAARRGLRAQRGRRRGRRARPAAAPRRLDEAA